jgi:fibronectin-binding autotransporter adhesin
MKWAVNRLVGLLIAIAFLAALGTAQAQNATWGTSPGTSDWNTNTNWTPQTVPSGTATFGSSNTTSITFSANGGTGTIGEILFNAGAPAYSFSFSGAFQALTITGVGIVNNSSNISTFFNAAGGTLVFRNTSAAGNATIINNSHGFTRFFNTSTAGNAAITTNSGGFTLFSNASTGGNATITNNGGLTQFFDTSTGGNARFITNAGGTFNISSLASGGMTAGSIEGAGIYFLGSKSLTVGGNNLSTEVSGTISGTGGSLVKVGSGTLVLSGTNTYTGGTTISAGTLQLGSGGASGSIPGNVVDNGVFAINRSDALTFGGVISGTGSFQQLGTGTTILTTANSYSGGTTISAGVLNVSADHNLGAASGGLTLNGGTLQFGSTFNLANTRTITLNGGGGTFDTDAFNTTISQRITGVGGLIKTGPGILTLSGSDSYSGGTVINAGILLVNNAQALGPGRNERIARLIHQCDSVIARQPYCIKCHLA